MSSEKRGALLMVVLATSVFCAACAATPRASRGQRATLESQLVGRHGWLKRDVTVGDGLAMRVIPHGTHVTVEGVGTRSTVDLNRRKAQFVLRVRTDSGELLALDPRQPSFDERAYARFLDSTLLLAPSQAEMLSILTTDAGNAPHWTTVDLSVDLDVSPEGNLITRLQNRTEVPITVDWTLSSLVGPDAVAHRVVPSSTLRRDVGKHLSSATIPPGARIEEVLLAEDLIDLVSGIAMPLLVLPNEPDARVVAHGSLLLGFTKAGTGGVTYETFRFRASAGVVPSPKARPAGQM